MSSKVISIYKAYAVPNFIEFRRFESIEGWFFSWNGNVLIACAPLLDAAGNPISLVAPKTLTIEPHAAEGHLRDE